MRSPASLMPTGRPAAAGTALTRKTGTAPNANCSVGPPPKWPTEGRRQGRRRGSLTRLRYKAPGDVESSTRGDSPVPPNLRTIFLLAVTIGLGRAQTVTFNEHIAPIVYGNCSKCHHPGEVAPFSRSEEHTSALQSPC